MEKKIKIEKKNSRGQRWARMCAMERTITPGSLPGVHPPETTITCAPHVQC